MAEAIEQDVQDQGLTRTLKDLFAGAVGGVAQVLIDILSSAITTSGGKKHAREHHTDIIEQASHLILKHEGAPAFYKGTLTPLIGIGACVSVQFGAFNYARRAFEAQNASRSGTTVGTTADTAAQPLSYSQYYAAGAFAGISNTLLSAPIEHVRIRLQTQPHGAARLYAGPVDCIAQLSRSPSIARGLYRGTSVTLLREAQAYGFWFLTFEYLMTQDARRNGVARSAVPTWKVALYGGLAGEMLWISSYPFDVVKSKMQTDAFGERQRYRSMRDAFAQIWRQEGMLGFWRGVGPTLLRAMPVSAGTFAVVEMTMRMIS